LPLTLFFEDSKGRVAMLKYQKIKYLIPKKMNRKTGSTSEPFFHWKMGKTIGDAQGFAAGPIIL